MHWLLINVNGVCLPPQMFDVSPCSIVWMNKELCVAAFSIPDLEKIPVDRFADGVDEAIITRKKLKQRWREFTSDDAMYLLWSVVSQILGWTWI